MVVTLRLVQYFLLVVETQATLADQEPMQDLVDLVVVVVVILLLLWVYLVTD